MGITMTWGGRERER